MSAEKCVEGEWKNFVFKMVQPDDYSSVLEHLRQNFYKDEPINKCIGASPEKDDDFDSFTMYNLQFGLSFIALDKDTQKIAGVIIVSVKEKNRDMTSLLSKIKSTAFKQKFVPFVRSLEKEAKIFDIYKNIDCYAHWNIISVDRDFRCNGLASELARRSVNMLQAKGYFLLDSIFTNRLTKLIGIKMNFKELASAYFRDFKDDNGITVLSQAEEDDMATLMVLELQQS